MLLYNGIAVDVTKLHYKVLDFDSECRLRYEDPLTYDHGPIRVMDLDTDGSLETALIYGMLGRLVGFGLVVIGTRFKVYGTYSTLSLLNLPLPMRDKNNTNQNYTDAFYYLENVETPRDRIIAKFKEDRVALLRVQHRITQDFPELRVWDSKYNVEVELRRNATHGGQRIHLLGCVWTPEFYTSGEVRKELDLPLRDYKATKPKKRTGLAAKKYLKVWYLVDGRIRVRIPFAKNMKVWESEGKGGPAEEELWAFLESWFGTDDESLWDYDVLGEGAQDAGGRGRGLA